MGDINTWSRTLDETKMVWNDALSQKFSDILWGDIIALLKQENIYLSSALYLIYWYDRTKNNPTNHAQAYQNMLDYFGKEKDDLVHTILENQELQELAKEHVENESLVHQTIDLYIEKNVWEESEILTLSRPIFPKWPALIGGLLQESDFENPLWIDAQAFAALRIAGEKIFQNPQLRYGIEKDEVGGLKYYVETIWNTHKICLSFSEISEAYRYKDEVKKMVKPSDPRHIVDTKIFRLEYTGEVQWNIQWRNESELMDLSDTSPFAFTHHRQLASVMKSKRELRKTVHVSDSSHHEFVRNMIHHPYETYEKIHERFKKTRFHPETPMPEFYPLVQKLISDLYSDEINTLCMNNDFALAQRHLIDNDLKHCASNVDALCPYQSTLLTVYKAIEFFDIVQRIKKWFYDNWKKDSFNIQDPGIQQYAYFFRTKYKNHLDALFAKFPDEIIIPTFEHIWATDLIKVRAIPLRFVGLSTEFLYVDEFWQSPVEFFLHDTDHSLRMAEEDEKLRNKTGYSQDEFIQHSLKFTQEILTLIKISPEESEEVRELKKLKKVLIFEICHEDARPLTRETIAEAIQTEEGKDIHREKIVYDPDTQMYKRESTIEAQGGISPLAFMLHKLQHGFFDQVDNQLSQIVHPKYRTSEYIAQAAYELLRDIQGEKLPWSPLDSTGNVSYEWLLQRTCSKSVRKVHHTNHRDPKIEQFWDGTLS